MIYQLDNLGQFEDKGVNYIIKDPEVYRNKKVVIAGGGDSALDWAIFLADVAAEVSLVHRRNEFRGALDSVEKARELAQLGKIKLYTKAEVKELHGSDQLQAVVIEHADADNIGEVKYKGETFYDQETQSYTLSGSGTNMWFGQDEFLYAFTSIQGDFILRARVEFLGEGVDPHRKVGWMVRNNLHSDAAHVNASVHGDGLTSLQYRPKKASNTEEKVSTDTAPDIIQLERKGNTYIMSTAKYGEPFTSVQVAMDLRNEVFVGIYVCSHNPDVVEKAVYKNVRITKPPKEGFYTTMIWRLQKCQC